MTTNRASTKTFFTSSPMLLGSLFSLPLLLAGCNKPIDDATLTTNVQGALAADTTISRQTIRTSVQGGVVTLSGNVSDDTAKAVADQDGNFYSATPITFPAQTDVTVCTPTSVITRMTTTITSAAQGGCNSCHVTPAPSGGAPPLGLM